MSSRYTGPFKKGMKVFLRYLGEEDNGSVIEDHMYRIRSVGKTQAILDLLPSKSKKRDDFFPSRRGTTYYLYTAEVARERSARWAGFYPTDWSQLFAMAGQNGWDPDQNLK